MKYSKSKMIIINLSLFLVIFTFCLKANAQTPGKTFKTNQKFNYTIQSGDTLYLLAQKFNNSLTEIKVLNPGINPNNLKIGEEIKLNISPELDFYTVQAGDTLWKISQKFSIPLNQIKNINNLQKIDYLSVGEILIIPQIPKKISTVLYFLKYTDTDAYLVPEIRKISFTAGLYLSVVNELIKGPNRDDLSMPIPQETEIKDITIKNGTALVDFSSEIFQANLGAAGEGLLLTAITNSLTEYQEITSVKLLAEGNPIDSLGGHIELRKPLYRNLDPVRYEN